MTSRRSSSATSSRLDQHPEVRKKAMVVNSFALKIFPFFSILQRSTFSYRGITYITLLFAILQHILISVFPNLYPNSQIDKIIASIFLFSYPSYNNTHINLEIIVLGVGYVALFFFIATVIRYKLKGTINKVEIAVMNMVMHFLIPLLIPPLASNSGSDLTALINDLSSSLSTNVLFVLNLILWLCYIGIFYFSTLFSSSTIFFHDSACVYFESTPIFFTYLFNSILAFLIWISKDFNVKFPYFIGALNIVLDIFLLYHAFNFPFAYLYVTTLAASTLTSCIFGSIGIFIGGKLDYLRYVLVLVSFLISAIIYHIIFKFVSKKIIRKEEFVNDRLAIKQLRLAVSQNDPSFISGKIIEMIVQGTNNYTVRLELAKFVCYFQELQPQFTAQLAMLRNATSLSMSESFLFYQLRIAETGRQPLCAVDELMPLRDETKKLEMTIRAAWKYIQNNNDFFAPSIMEPINRQKQDCMGHWQDALSKYPRNALLAEEYAHFLVECKSDFDNAAFWHYSALQLQDGKIFRYDAACLNFLHIFPEYAAKVISKSNISTMDDLDVKAKEDALGQLVEHPRLRLEYQRAISNHLTFALPMILGLSIIKFLAFWIFWIILAMYFTGLFSGTVTRIHLIKNSSDIGEATTLSMLSFAFNLANTNGEVEDIYQMDESIGTDRINHTQYMINPNMSFLDLAHELTEEGTNTMTNVYNGMINEVIAGENLTKSINFVFNQSFNISYTNSSFSQVYAGQESLAYIIAMFLTSTHVIASTEKEEITKNTMSYDSIFLSSTIVDNIFNFSRTFITDISNDVGNFKLESFIVIFIVYSAFFLISELVLVLLYNSKISKTVKSCKKFPPEVFDSSSANIFIAQISTDAPNLAASISKTERSTVKTTILYMIEFVLTLICLLFIGLFILKVRMNQRNFQNLGNTLLEAAIRKVKAVESIYTLVVSNVFSNFRTNRNIL